MDRTVATGEPAKLFGAQRADAAARDLPAGARARDAARATRRRGSNAGLPRAPRAHGFAAEPRRWSPLSRAGKPIWATAIYGGLRRGELQALRQSTGTSRPRAPSRPPSRAQLGPVRGRRDRAEGAAGTRACRSRPPPRADAGHAGDGRPRLRPRSRQPSARQVHRARGRIWRQPASRLWALHECRHTYASLLIAAGVNIKAVQVFMGHATIAITLDRYGHLLPGAEGDAAAAADAYLGGRDRSRGEQMGNKWGTLDPFRRFQAVFSGNRRRPAGAETAPRIRGSSSQENAVQQAGGGGIRTLGPRERTPVFKTGAFDPLPPLRSGEGSVRSQIRAPNY